MPDEPHAHEPHVVPEAPLDPVDALNRMMAQDSAIDLPEPDDEQPAD